MISIIIPIYNAELYLSNCLNSILKQTYNDFEVIMVDDGSTDKSSRIAKSYQEMDCRFSYVHKDNGGVSSARNCGLNIANGEWLVFIDSDDWIDDKYLEVMLKCAENNNSDVVMCRRIDEKEDGYCKQIILQSEYIKKVKFCDFIPDEYDFYGTCWGFLFKKSIAEGIYFDEKISFTEDALYSVEVMSKSNNIVIVNEFLYYYNLFQHDSLSQGQYNEKKYSIIASRKKQLDLFRGYKGEREMKARLCDACFYIISIGYNNEDFKGKHYLETRKIFRKYFWCWNEWKKGNIIKKIFRFFYYINPIKIYEINMMIKSLIKRKKI